MFYNSVVGGWNYPLLGNTARLLRLYRLGSALRALLFTLAYWITSVQPTYTTYRVYSQPFWIGFHTGLLHLERLGWHLLLWYLPAYTKTFWSDLLLPTTWLAWRLNQPL